MECLLEKMFDQDNVDKAMFHMLEKKNTTDSTGLELYRLPEFWEINQAFYREIVEGECYLCETVPVFHVQKKNGSLRMLANIPHIDMLLARMLYQVLSPVVNERLSDSCFAFVPGRSIAQLVQRAVNWMEEGRLHCAHMDIENFFDNIPHEALLRRTEEVVSERRILSLLKSFLQVKKCVTGRSR